MIIDQSLHCIPSEYLTGSHTLFVQCLEQQSLKDPAEPVVDRNIEADLRTRKNRLRQLVLHQFSQDVLQVRAVDLELFRQLRRELDDAVVQEWRPHLQ